MPSASRARRLHVFSYWCCDDESDQYLPCNAVCTNMHHWRQNVDFVFHIRRTKILFFNHRRCVCGPRWGSLRRFSDQCRLGRDTLVNSLDCWSQKIAISLPSALTQAYIDVCATAWLSHQLCVDQVRAVCHVHVCVVANKTFWTYTEALSSLDRWLQCRTQLFDLMNNFQIRQFLILIFIVIHVTRLLDQVDFCQAVFCTF